VNLDAKTAMAAMPDVQRYPWKLYLNKYELDLHDLLLSGFFAKVTFAHFLFITSNGETEVNTFRKTTWSSTFLIRIRFEDYRWKWGIAIFAWRVTRNYAFSPFKQNNIPVSQIERFLLKQIITAWFNFTC